MPTNEVRVLLVGQGLDRRCVEALAALCEPQEHRELPHDRLAGSGWRGDEHPRTGFQVLTGPCLVVVEAKSVTIGESSELGAQLAAAKPCVCLGRRVGASHSTSTLWH